VAILLAAALTLLYGWLLGPPLADREPLVKAAASLGFALIVLGFMQWHWSTEVRTLSLPTSDWQYTNGWLIVNWTQGLGILFPIVVAALTVVVLNRTKVGTGMRALADNRDNSALLGVPVRKVEAVAWFGSGVLFGVAGLLLASLVSMDIAPLTFTLPVAALAAALIGRVQSLWMTVVAAFVIGVIQSSLGAMSSLAQYRTTTPFVIAIVVLIWFGWRGQTQQRIA
jgi:branched-chain amino acid transport system permease protein